MSSENSFAKKLIPLVVLGGACLIAFVVAEVALRGMGFAYPVQTQSDFHLGYALVPDATWEHTSEGYSTVETNSFGFCDRPWVIEKPAGVKRIAVIGDSFVAALEVDQEKRFTNLIEAGLNSGADGQTKIEVMNFGQPGFGTAQELMVLRHKVMDFDPDMVILAIFTGNDVRNNLLKLEQEPMLPYFELVNGELVLDGSFREHKRSFPVRAMKAMAPYLRLVQLATKVSHRAQGSDATADPMETQLREVFPFTNPVSEVAVYGDPVGADWAHAWILTEALLDEFKRECDDNEIEFKVVSLSNDVQVHPDATVRERLAEIVPIQSWHYPEERFTNLFETLEVDYLPLAPRMQEHAVASGVMLHGFDNWKMGAGHWNEDGHRYAATEILQWLNEG